MKKRAITLIEIMIVIMLIGLIGGAIGYNVKGSLKRGKEFKTERARSQLEDIFEICIQEGMVPEYIVNNTEEALRASGLAKDPESLLKDGTGRPFVITYDQDNQKFIIQ